MHMKTAASLMFRALLVAASLFLAFQYTAVAEDAPPPAKSAYIFGVFPYLPPLEMEKLYAPIVADFNHALNRELQLASKTSFELFTKNLKDQTYDVAFIQPFDYVNTAHHYGYVPLAARREKLYALIVTTTDSEIKAVTDLKRRRVGLPPRDAAISHLVRAFLRKSGLDTEKDLELVYFRSHSSCLNQLIAHAVEACGTSPTAMNQLRGSMSNQLRGIAETDRVPPALFVVHQRVPADERKRLLDTIASWGHPSNPSQVRLNGYFPIDDAAYDEIRKFPAE